MALFKSQTNLPAPLFKEFKFLLRQRVRMEIVRIMIHMFESILQNTLTNWPFVSPSKKNRRERRIKSNQTCRYHLHQKDKQSAGGEAWCVATRDPSSTSAFASKSLGLSTLLTQWLFVDCRNRNCVLWRIKKRNLKLGALAKKKMEVKFKFTENDKLIRRPSPRRKLDC